ncbi:MAG: 30S ribosomal protein S9 [bacterium]
MVDKNSIVIFGGTGNRKSACSRVWMKAGKGLIQINGRNAEEYFKLERSRMIIMHPLILTETQDQYDIKINVKGGGPCGQAEAVRHGIARALLNINSDFRQKLKKAGYLTRDSRVKERKKYGQKGARARYQFSKR